MEKFIDGGDKLINLPLFLITQMPFVDTLLLL